MLSPRITDDLMASDQTGHRAVRVSAPCQPQHRRVSRLLGRNEAVAVMPLADTQTDVPPATHSKRPLSSAYAIELRLETAEVLARLTAHGGAR